MTGDTEHPTYPNPTIAEALCQIEFAPPPESGWRIGRPTAFLHSVSAEYPNIEPIGGPGVSVTVDQSGVMPQLVQMSTLKLSNEENNRYVAVGDRHFTFGHLRPYPGWDLFRAKLLTGWESFCALAKIPEITKTSLRYVNLIPRTTEHPLISDWLRANHTVPEAVIRSKRDPFLVRVESWFDTNSLLIVTVGIRPGSGVPPSIIFDIQRTSIVKTQAAPSELIGLIDALHNDIWHEFSSAKTLRLEAHLKGQQP